MSSKPALDCPENDLMLLKAIEVFTRNFGSEPEVAVYAPGRVNLIGEHTDYNDGFVLPFALPFRTIVVASKIVDSCGYSCIDSNIVSCTIDESNLPVSFRIDDTLQKGQPTWANYVKGTIYHYLKDLPMNFALNAVIISNVPLGSGLSSSAALEVAIGTALEQLCGLTNVNGVEKALRCQKAEHTFCDTPCGIMDQFISSLGEKGKLLLIDCRYQTYNAIPFGDVSDKDSPVVVVTNSLVKHQLSGSEYPDRVRQCKEAVAAIKTKYPAVTALRDCTMEMLDTVQKGPHAVSSLVYKRARHGITEDTRTQGAVAALARGDYAEVGRLMTASHKSLRDDYDVSCKELDVLVEAALGVQGVYGSRMTGGGFGGCTVTLVERSAVPALLAHLKQVYLERCDKLCECYIAEPSEGSGVIDMKACLRRKQRKEMVDWVIPALAISAIAAAFAMRFLASRK